MVNRLDRRLTILRGKRAGCFDERQYYLEGAVRARASRRVRTLLRFNRPVLMVTPRWSQPHRFFDDIALDLAIGEPSVDARLLTMDWLQGRSERDAWALIGRAVVGLCGLVLDGPVSQWVDRRGFRTVITDLLRRTMYGPRRALLIHGVEYIHLRARDDLVQAFIDHMEEAGSARSVNLLLASAVHGPGLELPGATRLVLPDFGDQEAIEALIEHVGPRELAELERLAEPLGGVPALIDAVGFDVLDRGVLPDTPDALRRALGSLVDEIRGVLDIAVGDEVTASRLEKLANDGELPADPNVDGPLIRAGLLSRHRAGRKVRVRAQAFSSLLASDPA